jgi:pimeloyl-ACP methyl ester carboxylesterase
MKHLFLIVLLSATACMTAPTPRIATAPASFPMLQPCTLEKVEAPAFCGKLDVPENRDIRGGRTIALNVAVVPARSPSRLADPVVAFLGGGPGVAGVPELTSFLATNAELARDRDVIAIDARGTGESNPLRCPMGGGAKAVQAFLAGELPPDEIRACRARLEAVADLSAYTTAAAADDADAVRRWLGYGPINVYGGSYSSRIALVYAQRYPLQTRTAVLKSPMPFALRNPLQTARDSQASLDRLFADCAADAGCSAAFPTLRDDFYSVMTTLATAPRSVEVDKEPVAITPAVFAGVIRRMLYSEKTQSAIPLTIAALRDGNPAPLQRILGAAGQIDRVLNTGLFLSVTCAEDVAAYDAADVVSATRGTFTGDRLAGTLLNICGIWPQGQFPRDFDRNKRSPVPTLVIAGALDPQTPPRWADEVRKLLPNTTVVVAEGIAHTGTTPCLTGILQRFVSAPNAAATIDTSCAKSGGRPPFTLPK